MVKVSREMIEAGAYVLNGRYDVASETFAESLAEEIFDEMLAAWFEEKTESRMQLDEAKIAKIISDLIRRPV